MAAGVSGRVIANLAGVSLRNGYTERFERFVRAHHRSRRLVMFTRPNARGLVRHYLQVPAGKMPAFIAAFGKRQGVLGLFCVRHRDADHLFLRIGAEAYHLEWVIPPGGEGCWTVNAGGRRSRFRESGSFLTERLVHLSATEFARLRARANGLMQAARRSGGLFEFDGNCVNAWMRTAVGDRGESLSQVIGIQEDDFGPRVMREILEGGNERVLGAAIYPPRGYEFRRFERTREPF